MIVFSCDDIMLKKADSKLNCIFEKTGGIEMERSNPAGSTAFLWENGYDGITEPYGLWKDVTKYRKR